MKSDKGLCIRLKECNSVNTFQLLLRSYMDSVTGHQGEQRPLTQGSGGPLRTVEPTVTWDVDDTCVKKEEVTSKWLPVK